MQSKLFPAARMYLAMTVVLLVGLIAVVAAFVPAAMAVLDKLVPVLMLVLGYYFGQRQ